MKSNKEILLVETEEVTFEGELQEKIDKELIKYNVTDALISKLKEEFSGLTLKSPTDTESYLELREARKEVRKIEILGEKAFKKLKEYPNQVRNFILGKEKTFAEKFSVIYPNLDGGIKIYEDEKERIEREEREKKENEFVARQAALLKYGADFITGKYVLGAIEYDMESIKEQDHEVWADIILPKYKKVFEQQQQEIVEAENKRKEDARILKEQQDKLKADQDKLDFDRKEMEDWKAQKKKMEDDAALKEKQDAAEKLRLAGIEEEKIWRGRLAQLKNVEWKGIAGGEAAWYNGQVIITLPELIHINDEVFSAVKEDHNAFVENHIKEIALRKKHEDDLETQRKIDKALQDEKDKLERERIASEELRAQAGDKEKWSYLLSQISGIQIPEMKSPSYRKKVAILKEKLQEVNDL